MGWIKFIFKLSLGIAGVAIFLFILNQADEDDRKYCEENIANKLKTTAVYINNHCMVKGYGRADGK